MKNLRRIVAGALALVFLLVLRPAAAEMDARRLKKDLKQADKQWKSGQVDSALELYEGILAGTEPAAPERANALYALALASLSPDSARHDPERARTLLAELTGSFSRHSRRMEIQALASLLEAQNATAEKAGKLEQRLTAVESQRAETSGEKESLETELEELRQKLEATERTLAANRAALRTAKEEMAKKEEALEKLTERLVGRSGG